MSSGNSTPDGNLVDILSVLESSTTGNTERHEAYQKFTRFFKENEISLFDMDVVKNISRVLTVISHDILLPSPDVSQCALQVLGVCLHDSQIVRSMSMKESEGVLQSLVDCIFKTDEKGTCTRALWCIGKQNLPAEAVTKKVTLIVEAVEYSVDKFGSLSVTIEHESVNTIARLADQCRKELAVESAIWGKVLLPMVVNSAIKVRERALNVLELTMDIMKTHRKDIVTGVMPIFKTKVFPELKKLFDGKHELYVLRCWGIIVQLFGEELHHGSYINNVLPVVEMGFKSQAADVKIAAFSAWQQLIDNFATSPNVLGDPKRIKLIMQVFKINNAKAENIAIVKIKVWWHFIWLLGNKLTANFDMVATPLLHFCIGGSRGSDQNGPSTPRMLQNGSSPKTPQMNLTTSSTQFPVFPALQQLGCEALAHFLGSTQHDGSTVQHCFSLDHLRQDVITGPSFFIKQSNLLITSATELFISRGKDMPERLLFHIWDWLVVHLKNAIESPLKLDIRDTLNTLLTRFQVVVLSRVLSSHTLLNMFQIICQLPEKVLSSSAYSIGGNEMINGTPALFLAGLLLTPNLLQSCSGKESYHSLFKTIISRGVGNSSGTLRFLQSLLELIGSSGKVIEDLEMVWRLWSAIVNPLLEHITKTNEVNQGDSLEPNFDCCVIALTFPVELRMASMTQPTVKSLIKTWIEVYKTVNRLAAMVTNASANIICEDVCQKLLELNKSSDMVPENVDMQVQFCLVMTTSLDFSSVGSQSSFNLAAVYSPKKSIKRKTQPLANIHSLVTLLSHLHKLVLEMVGDSEHKKQSVSLQTILNNLVDIYSTIFTHVNSTGIIGHIISKLGKPIGMLFSEASKKTSAKLYNNPFQQKLEKLWMEMCTCLQSRYQGIFDSNLLAQLSPLLEANFLHTRRQIKNQTVGFWTSTFGNVATLVYPETLGPVLTKVKEKSVIQLPGWVNMDKVLIEETPISQMSQSQYPEPRIPGMPSPHKIHGSFLNKAVSPKPKRSPMKSPVMTRAANSAKMKVFKGFDVSNDADFVVIKSSPKKKMVLTEHQREIMKERKVLPAMYNNLEMSMDASLMASHFTSDTQMESSNSTPTPTTEKLPFSLFGSVISGETGSNKDTDDDNKNKPKSSPAIPTAKSTRSKTKGDGKEANVIKSPDPDTSISRRRSGLSRKLTKDTKQMMSGKEESSKLETKDSDVDKVVEKLSEIVAHDRSKVQPEGSVIVIDESEPMDLEPSQLILQLKGKTAASHEEIDLTKDSQVSQSESSFSLTSVPQNVLGAVGPTPPSSEMSSDSAKDADGSKQSLNSLQPSLKCGQTEKEESTDMTEIVDKELSASEPLLSWAQKLEELSQSPGPKKSPFHKSLSQDVRSPSKRGKSPLKSPRGKSKENLNLHGALDKWIIRSPTKGVPLNIAPNVNSEIIVQSILSGTFIEETQSPSKFNQKEKNALDKTNSPSVMETPTKTILEELDVNHGSHSNRKLFDSQGSNHGLDIVEDSNLIPASPTSKSFSVRTGTPIVKMKKLSASEIKRYSPNNKVSTQIMLSPSKNCTDDSAVKKVKCVVNFSNKALEDENSHEHDDFSDLRPLENNETDINDGFSSKSLTSTDKVLLEVGDELKGENLEEKVCDKSADPVSPTLFSQLNEQNDDVKSQIKYDTDIQLVDNNKCDSVEIGSQGFQTDLPNNDVVDKSSNMSQEKETPRRGRKRKQVTPKKMSPEDAKLQRKKAKLDGMSETNHKVGRKISNRLKEKKEKQKLNDSQESMSDCKSQDDDNSEGTKESAQLEDTVEIDTHTPIKLDGSQPSDEELKKNKKKKGQKTRKREAQEEDSEVQTEKTSRNDMTLDANKDEKANDAVGDSKSVENQKETTQLDNQVNDCDKEDTVTDQIQMEVDQIVGETTPKSRIVSKRPERRSTTKHKKEVAQKMVLKNSQENRDELFIDNDSNIDIDEHLLRKTNTVKNVDNDIKPKGESEIESKNKEINNPVMEILCDAKEDEEINKVTKALVECEKEKLTIVDLEIIGTDKSVDTNEKSAFVSVNEEELELSEKTTSEHVSDKSAASASDDDVPLSQLKNKNNKQKSSNEKLTKKIDTDLQKSPVSNKLRPNKVIGTRLRSGPSKTKTSPKSKQSKKSVTLALKRTRMRNKQKVNEETEDNMPVDSSDPGDDEDSGSTEPLVNMEKVEREFENETKKNSDIEKEQNVESSDKQHDNILDQNSIKEVFDSENSMEKGGVPENMIVKEISNKDETPRKLMEKSREAGSMLMMNSDSKLILGSRRFEKRKAIARRSILKPASANLSSHVGSPKRTDFRPIIVGRIYSPTASPSASILKKRRLMDVFYADTNSPPTKQRRVSFAEPLIEAGNVLTDTDTTTATGPIDLDKSEKSDIVPFKQPGSQLTQNSSCQSSEGSMTQGTYQSTQESQINSTEPVCPDLVDCKQSVENILPQLTSSIWSRGLGQLVRARNIKTIGDLSSLTENDIQSLPIRSPKVETVLKSLTRFQKSSKFMNSPRVRLESKIEETTDTSSQDEDPFNTAASQKGTHEAIKETSTDPVISNYVNKSEEKDIEDVLSSSSNLLDEMNRLSQNLSQEVQAGTSKLGSRTETSEKLVKHCKLFGACLVDNLKSLDKEQLVEVLKSISNVQMSLLGAINWKDM